MEETIGEKITQLTIAFLTVLSTIDLILEQYSENPNAPTLASSAFFLFLQ